MREPCDPSVHPSHAGMPYCPTHPLAPSLGHRTDLQHGGALRDAALEHFGCNAQAGARSKRRTIRKATRHQSWEW